MPHTQETLDGMAAEIFELYRLIAIARTRAPTGGEDLSETEFLVLDALTKQESQTIGDVQRTIGVVPAQMSRIVRSLERQGGDAYIECTINTEDRRRVNLALTSVGTEAYNKFKSNRLGSMLAVLQALEPEDRISFMRNLRQIRMAFEERLNKAPTE